MLIACVIPCIRYTRTGSLMYIMSIVKSLVYKIGTCLTCSSELCRCPVWWMAFVAHSVSRPGHFDNLFHSAFTDIFTIPSKPGMDRKVTKTSIWTRMLTWGSLGTFGCGRSWEQPPFLRRKELPADVPVHTIRVVSYQWVGQGYQPNSIKTFGTRWVFAAQQRA